MYRVLYFCHTLHVHKFVDAAFSHKSKQLYLKESERKHVILIISKLNCFLFQALRDNDVETEDTV
jgi:hypothetical protein